MFKRIDPAPGVGDIIHLTFNGHRLQARRGDSVAAALLTADVSTFRHSAVNNVPRAPYCMMGVCFECLVQIDGVANRQACLTIVQEGMNVRLQDGNRSL